MDILSLLSHSEFIIYNRSLAHKIGVNPTIIFMDLVSKHRYFEAQNKLDNGYFFNTIENIFESTALTRKQQDTAIKKLQEINLLEVVIKGIPAKRYFKINKNALIELFSEKKPLTIKEQTTWKTDTLQFVPKGQTSMTQTDNLDVSKRATNKNNITINTKTTTNQVVVEKKEYLENNTYKELMGFNFLAWDEEKKEKIIIKILEDFSQERINEVLEAYKIASSNPLKTIANPAWWILSALHGKYEFMDEQKAIKQKQQKRDEKSIQETLFRIQETQKHQEQKQKKQQLINYNALKFSNNISPSFIS